jgi:hypothetical protein
MLLQDDLSERYAASTSSDIQLEQCSAQYDPTSLATGHSQYLLFDYAVQFCLAQARSQLYAGPQRHSGFFSQTFPSVISTLWRLSREKMSGVMAR